MKTQHVRPKSQAAFWSARFGFFAFMLLLIGFCLHFLSFITEKDFFALVASAALIALIALLLSFLGLFDLWRVGAYGGKKTLRGFIFSLLVLSPLIYQLALSFYYPAFYDISTDLQNPPLFIDIKKRPSDALPIKETLYDQQIMQEKLWPDLIKRCYDANAEQMQPLVLNVLEEKRWVYISTSSPIKENEDIESQIAKAIDIKRSKTSKIKGKKMVKSDSIKEMIKENNGPDTILIQALAKTSPFFLSSDIAIRLQNADSRCCIDMRTTSRYLTRDGGKNAELILNFMKDFDTEILLKQKMTELYMQNKIKK